MIISEIIVKWLWPCVLVNLEGIILILVMGEAKQTTSKEPGLVVFDLGK